VPYIRGGEFGIYVNLGSIVLADITDTKPGMSGSTILNQRKATQGFGISVIGVSFEYTRNLQPYDRAENIITSTILVVGAEFNLTSGEISLGFMPSMNWAVGLGINGSVKYVVKILKNE